MDADDVLEAIYVNSNKKYLAPANMKPIQEQFGDRFRFLYDKLDGQGFLHRQIRPVGQIVLSPEGFERAEQLFG